jgi:hypothetical protein
MIPPVSRLATKGNPPGSAGGTAVLPGPGGPFVRPGPRSPLKVRPAAPDDPVVTASCLGPLARTAP